MTPSIKETELQFFEDQGAESLQDRILLRGDMPETGLQALQFVSLKYLAEYWSAYACEKTTQGQERTNSG